MKSQKFIRKPYLDNLRLIHQGKVRETYATDEPGVLLVVATDVVSTHNVAHRSLVPDNGQILTALSVFWATEVFPDIPTHIIAHGRKIYGYLPPGRAYPTDLHLRALIAYQLRMDPFKYVYHARMAGSLWSSYQKGEANPYGLELPDGLELMSPFDEVQFTPTEKSEADNPVKSADVLEKYPESVILTREIYQRGREFALKRGIDIIDFKAEVGRGRHGWLYLADEYLNGECCHFVRTGDIVIGKEPPWADKQRFRDEAVKRWNGAKVRIPLEFSEETIATGMKSCHDVFWMMTGRSLEKYQREFL